MTGRRRPIARIAAATVVVAMATGVTGCGEAGNGDPLQVADVLTAAEPATSPQVTASPAGRVLPLGGPAGATVIDPVNGVLAVAVTGPDRVLLYRLTALAAGTTTPDRTVPLPGPADQLGLGVRGEVLAPVRTADTVVRIGTADGAEVTTVTVKGGPISAVGVADRLAVALADDKAVVVLDGERVVHTVRGIAGAADVVAIDGRVAVLDRLRTAIATLDPATGRLGPALRAGDGATNAAGDRFGRVLVTDTRGGELLAFSAEPMIMRQRYPVPGAPYAIAYDSARDLAWVTLTERNEVVGFDVAGGEPVERYRLATVRQPDAVAVDSGSGTVVVVSGTGEGMQVVRP